MSMKKFQCDTLDLSFQFSTEGVDRDALTQAVGVTDIEKFIDEDGDVTVGLTIDAREEETDYHAHMRIFFPKEGKGRIEVSYHNSKARVEGERRPPFVEDCVPWLSDYLKIDKVQARTNAAYEFDKSFSPVVTLPFPLVTSEKAIAGSLVTGLSLFLNKEPPVIAIIQVVEDATFVSLSVRSEISLKEFDLVSELEGLSVSVNSLVRRQEADNASDNRRDKE